MQKIVPTIVAAVVTAGVLIAPLPAVGADGSESIVSRLYDRLDDAHDTIDCLRAQNKDLRTELAYERHSAGKAGQPVVTTAGPTRCGR